MIALPNTFAPATISRIATVVTMESNAAALKSAQLSERRKNTTMISDIAKPIAAASVGVKAPE